MNHLPVAIGDFGDGPGDTITVFGNKIGTDAGGAINFGNGGPGIGVYGTGGSTIGGTNPGEANVGPVFR